MYKRNNRQNKRNSFVYKNEIIRIPTVRYRRNLYKIRIIPDNNLYIRCPILTEIAEFFIYKFDILHKNWIGEKFIKNFMSLSTLKLFEDNLNRVFTFQFKNILYKIFFMLKIKETFFCRILIYVFIKMRH